MKTDLEMEELVALLLDEHKYDEPLSPKAVHKILYVAEDELERERVSVELPTYWYMYGPVAAMADTCVTLGGEDAPVSCNVEISDIDAPSRVRSRGRRTVRRALDEYYEHGLEGLTERIYDDAPYDVQRHYRRLDEQLEMAATDGQLTIYGGKNEEQTRETLYDFIESFPVTEFPEYEDDLHIWYRLMSAELDSDEYDPERAQLLAGKFWRFFCLELACHENDGLTREEIATELDIDSVDAEKRRIRTILLSREQAKARRNARESEVARKAAEAFVVPHLEFEVTT